jgi:hypothetical protein
LHRKSTPQVKSSTITNAGDGFFFASALASTGTALLEEGAVRPYYSQAAFAQLLCC